MYSQWDLEELKKRIKWEALLRSLGAKDINPTMRRCKCPLHDGQNNSSFAWYRERFKCFSCDRRGDAIDLIRLITGKGFRESVQFLCDLTGYHIKEDSGFNKVRIYEREIPKYFEKKHSNPNYEEIEFRNRLERAKETQARLTKRMHQLVCNGAGDTNTYILVENVANLIDTEVNALQFELRKIGKN